MSLLRILVADGALKCPECNGALRGVFEEHLTMTLMYVEEDAAYGGGYLDEKIDQGDLIFGESDLTQLTCHVCPWHVHLESVEVELVEQSEDTTD